MATNEPIRPSLNSIMDCWSTESSLRGGGLLSTSADHTTRPWRLSSRTSDQVTGSSSTRIHPPPG